MTCRVGYILRHEDIHGVSGEGKVADIFEGSNGKCVVIWLSANTSVNVYDNIKGVENIHGHNGKTEVIWSWEQEPDPDPMDKILVVDKPKLTKAEMVELAEETAEEVAGIAATKVKEKIAEKVAEKREEIASDSEKPEGKTKKNGKKTLVKKNTINKKDKE